MMLGVCTDRLIICRRLAAVLAMTIALAGASPTFGSEHAEQKPVLPEGFKAVETPFLADGYLAFQDRRYRDALKDFDQFIKLNPNDGRGYLFRGLTLNRLDAFRLALADLLRAEELGQSFSRLDVEIAWAWLETGGANQARLRLESYLEATPNDAKAHEFLGRAWMVLGDLDKGGASLKRALELDPDLESTVRYYLAAIENRRGNTLGAVENLAGIIIGRPESRLGQRLGELFPQIRAAPPVKPWRVVLNFGLAYNDNVIALPDDFALPEDISSKQSFSKHLSLSAAYDLRRSSEDVLTAGYTFDARYNNQVEDFDVADQFAYLNYARRLNADLTASVLLSEEYTIVDDKAFRNEIALRQTLSISPWENTTLEGAYRIAVSNYLSDTAAVNDRDGFTHTVSATVRYGLPAWDTQLTATYAHSWIGADGANFDAQSDSIRLGVKAELPFEVTGETTFSRTWDDYDNPNTLSLAGRARSDKADRLAARLSRPLYGFVSAYVTYTRIDRDSNINFFEFSQNQWETGLTMTF